MLCMVTFTINIPPMLLYIPYMDPMGIYYCELCTIIILWVCLKIGYPQFLWMIFPSQNGYWRPPGQSDAPPSLSQSQSCCTASQPRNAGENHTLCCGALKPIANLLTIIQYNTIIVMLHYCGLYVCPCMRLIVSYCFIICKRPVFANQKILLRIFCEARVYLSRGSHVKIFR